MSQKPNIILILTDQQRYDTIAALGASHVDTPNIDRLVETGTSFDNCFITSPSCVPSRASLFTGLYPHTNGVLRNGANWSRTWVDQLREAGYRTVNIGKMHTVPYDAKAGFDERIIVENKDRYLDGRWFLDAWDQALGAQGYLKPQRELYRKRSDYGTALGAFQWDLPEKLHSDNFTGSMAQWWLNTKPVQEPLFLEIGFPGPHPPYDPTPELAAKYLARDDTPMPEVTQEELNKLPPPFAEKRVHDCEVDHDSIIWSENPTDEQLRKMRAYYLANVEMIDTQVGHILDTLEARGYLDNSIVIFTSDHGDCLGDHGMSQKWNMYDEVVRVPMIISAPGRFKGGQRIAQKVQLHDLGPTILEWAGCTPEWVMEGKSMNAALEGKPFEGHEFVFCEQAGDINLTGAEFFTMVRDDTAKLVHFKGVDYGQLFDLETDPEEVNNLWDNPDYAATKQRMMNALCNWLVDSNYDTRDVYAAAR